MSNARRNFGQWKILLICPDGELRASLAPLLDELLPFSPTLTLEEYPTRALLEEALSGQGPTLCFVDVTSRDEWALALLNDLALLNPKLPVVALHATSNPELILKSLRQGATEFLCQPLTEDQFCAVMERISSLHRVKDLSSAKVICFMPVKGGCGASTLAFNVASHMKKLHPGRIVLADLDPLTGTVAFLAKTKQTYSFLDALTRATEIDEDVWRGLVTSRNGLDVLAAPEQPAHGLDESSNPAALIDFMRSIYDLILLDAGGALGAWNIGLARLCDELVLVTTNELPALHAAQRVLSIFDRHRVEFGKIRLVVNRFRREIGLQKEIIEAALHMEVFHVIPYSLEDLQRALVEGRPVPASTPAGKGFLQVAEKLTGKSAEDGETASRPGGLAGIFSIFKR
ncbi:MAG: AAA family ATPase [Bryobacteraceae bacterium]|nr:AAA family ATPase [Bryobacteraceae bacterium]MCX7602917.1 AAA family ATPase [Bryobacteraceae bacterium]